MTAGASHAASWGGTCDACGNFLEWGPFGVAHDGSDAVLHFACPRCRARVALYRVDSHLGVTAGALSTRVDRQPATPRRRRRRR